MKVMASLLLTLFVSFNASAVDDHEVLLNLIENSDEFFENANNTSKLLYNYDANGTIQQAELSVTELRQVLEEFRGLNVDQIWTQKDQAKCESLSLSTAGMGACVTRALALSLATFQLEFKSSKKALRSKGDMGIEATKKLSKAVKSYTVYIVAACDEDSSVAYGGSGQGLMNAGCVTGKVYDAAEKMQQIRLVTYEPEGSLVEKAKAKASALSAGEWQQRVEEEENYLTHQEERLKEKAQEFFNDDWGKNALKVAIESFANANRTFDLMKVDYCDAYTAIVNHTSMTEYITSTAQMQGACMVDLLNQRYSELNIVIDYYSSQY